MSLKEEAVNEILGQVVPGDMRSLAKLVDGAHYALREVGKKNAVNIPAMEAVATSDEPSSEALRKATEEALSLLFNDLSFLHSLASVLREGLDRWLYADVDTMMMDNMERIQKESDV